HDIEIIKEIGKLFELHPLFLEDLLNNDQRPKVDFLDDYIYFVFKVLGFDEANSKITSEQLSIFFGQKYLISFQEYPGDFFNGIRERIRINKGRLRRLGADYLAHSILDVTVDHYFDVIELMYEKMDDLQENIFVTPTKDLPIYLYDLRQQSLLFRKYVWPVRQMVDQFQKSESDLIDDNTILYLKDVSDHALRVMEGIDTVQSTLDNIMETYLSLLGQKTNDAMRFLTVVTTLIMPPTLIAGIYGMNFVFMPELNLKWGYPLALLAMLASCGVMLIYFRRKKWL
ncbi:MAG: magnesium/cobalt transporter CorA, partial [bacterium]|nr:magnesium/cobalt transporter CorA [bacterium]